MCHDDESHSLLVRGIAAAKANNGEEARYFLARALDGDLSVDDRVQAWRYLARLSDDPTKTRNYLEQILATDPTDGTARRDLAILDGHLDQRDIIDPERLLRASELHDSADRTRFTCPLCGSSRVFFDPEAAVLKCAHCHHAQPANDSPPGVQTGERDFIATMWTARGHRIPQAMPSFTCDSCGASFLVAAGEASLTCAYCGSVYSIDRVSTRELLVPEAVIPFAITERHAVEQLEAWTRDRGADITIGPARGLFVPAWVLNFIGEVRWTAAVRDETIGDDGDERTSGAHTIIGCKVRVAGARHVLGPIADILNDFDLSGLRAYRPQLIAGWPTVAYDMTLDEAAVKARSRAIAALRPEVLEGIATGSRDVALDFSRMAVDAFTLALMPIWISELRQAEARVSAIVNGQSGTVRADLPRRGLAGWLEDLLS